MRLRSFLSVPGKARNEGFLVAEPSANASLPGTNGEKTRTKLYSLTSRTPGTSFIVSDWPQEGQERRAALKGWRGREVGIERASSASAPSRSCWSHVPGLMH